MPSYHNYTKYGRKKARYKYKTGTAEYRAEIDKYRYWSWAVVLIMAAVLGFLIFLVQGPE